MQVFPKLSFLLETGLVATEGDSPPVGQAKKVTADYLRQRYPMNGPHYAATLLDPRYKGPRFISPATARHTRRSSGLSPKALQQCRGK